MPQHALDTARVVSVVSAIATAEGHKKHVWLELPRLFKVAPQMQGKRHPSAWITLLAALAVSWQAHGAKYALVIGLNDYRSVHAISELKFAIADAEAIRTQLEALNYQVRLLKNDGAKRHDIVGELNRFAYKVQPEDTFLLYFAGHGVRRTGGDATTYWLTYDAQLDALDDEGIRLAHLMDYVRDIRARQKIVLLDHCYSGDAVDAPPTAGPVDVSGNAPAGTTADGSRGPAPIPLRLEARGQVSADQLRDQIPATAKGMLVIAAARNEAYESPTLGHGFFTQALLKALSTREASGGNEVLTATQLVNYLRTQVASLSNNKQQVSEFTSGTDLSTWRVVDKLPEPALSALDAAKRKRTLWGERLVEWSNQRYIKYPTRARCQQALQAWQTSLTPGGSPLSPIDEKIRAEIENHMNDTTTPADASGSDLEQAVDLILRPPPP